MKYFIINEEGNQEGPYSLEQLRNVGIRPTTYVWRKDFPTWIQAADDPDICRLMRQRLSGTAPEAPSQQPRQNPDDDDQFYPLRFGRHFQNAGVDPGDFTPPGPDTSVPPTSLLIPAILATLFCFPLTGFVACYYAYQSQRLWRLSENASPSEREGLRTEAHDAARSGKMWIGITLSLGLIVQSFIMFKLPLN